MKVKKAHSIDNIFKKTKDYDLILTVDAPLTDAMISRLENALLGDFVVTPKRLVQNQYQNENIAEQKELFIEIIRNTDLTWKQSFYLLENILSCWKETGKLKSILDYKQFDNKETRQAIEVIETTPNIYSAMENYEIEKDQSVAVVGLYQFNELDKKVLPEDYDVIKPFGDGKKTLPKFSIFTTITSIIQAIQKNIEKENAEDIAIVTPEDSEYQSLFKSVFQSENIPSMTKNNLAENEDLRTFITFLNLALSNERLRIRDIQPVLRYFGKEISIKHNEEFLKDLEIKEAEEFRKTLKKIEKISFEEAIEIFEKSSEKQEKIQEELEKIDMLNKPVTKENINRLSYYLDSFEIQTGSSERGILFASPKSTSYIDRPIIFYVGMDSSWTHSQPTEPWIDEERYESRNLNNFQLLLQNGNQQHFLVRDNSLGEKITPCLYFDELFEENFNSFSDLPHTEYWGVKEGEKKVFAKKSLDIGTKTENTISQTDLKKLVKSPKDYFFSKLIDKERKYYFRKGNLYHDFAEFYVNHPEFVKKQGIENFVEFMIKKIKPFFNDFALDRLKTEFRVGIKNIQEYLSEKGIESFNLNGYGKKYSSNTFADHFNLEIDSSITEAWFENPELGCKGKVDLIRSADHLIDYKSGRRKSATQIVKNSNIDLFEDNPDFQAILYLAHHRKIKPDTKLNFTFFYFLQNIEDQIMGEHNLEDNIVTITYYPATFMEKLVEKETFHSLYEGISENNNRRKVLEKLGFEKYRDFFENKTLPAEYDKEELLDSNLAEEFISFSKEIIGNYKYVTKGCKKALKKMVDFRKQNYFKEDLDAFEVFLKEQLKNLHQFKHSKFPVGEVDLDDLENRDLIIGDDFERTQ